MKRGTLLPLALGWGSRGWRSTFEWRGEERGKERRRESDPVEVDVCCLEDRKGVRFVEVVSLVEKGEG